ncbi:MAG: glycosyltransferase family 2 protein [Bdellovibrionota bacterium]
MPHSAISVTIITLNEEENITQCVESVRWADEILVVDSGSSDKTVELARSLGARVLHNAWPGYGQQKNFAQEKAAHDWVLNVDADEVVSPELAREIRGAVDATEAGRSQARGYFFPRKTFYLGRWIRHGGWYPNFLVRLADRRAASWTEPAVHEELRVRGEVAGLANPLDHYSFSSIQDQIVTNLRYSRLGSQSLQRTGQKPSVLKMIWKPVGKFFETYLLKGGFLDGLAGFIISINAAHSIFLKYAYLFEAKLKNENSRHRQ